MRLLPDYASVLPDPKAVMLPGALAMHDLGQGHGMCMVYTPSGPADRIRARRVATPPTSAPELLDWTRAHKNRFFYARPANSGPGRTWLMGLPYLLGDANPKDPMKGWDKSWAYLKELGENIEYYPTGTGQTMQELGQGSRDIILSTTRRLGHQPAGTRHRAQIGHGGTAEGLPLGVGHAVPDDPEGRFSRPNWRCCSIS